jgi:NDP-sugar pyrophosphorylase family protein
VTAYLATLTPAGIDRLDMTSLLRGLIGRRVAVRAVPVKGRWGEVDTPSDLAIYTDDLNRGLLAFPSQRR